MVTPMAPIVDDREPTGIEPRHRTGEEDQVEQREACRCGGPHYLIGIVAAGCRGRPVATKTMRKTTTAPATTGRRELCNGSSRSPCRRRHSAVDGNVSTSGRRSLMGAGGRKRRANQTATTSKGASSSQV